MKQRPPRVPRISPAAAAFVRDEPMPPGADEFEWLALMHDDAGIARRCWEFARAEVLSEWAAVRPGTRPSCWWRFDAAEPRKQVGGDSVPISERYPAYVREHRFGVPRIHVGAAAAEYESQAAYLHRMGQLGEEERARLTAADFQPDAFEPEEQIRE